MVEVIHEHDAASNNSGPGMMLGVILAILVILLVFIYFGRGLLSGSNTPQVNIPDHVNVNIQKSK